MARSSSHKWRSGGTPTTGCEGNTLIRFWFRFLGTKVSRGDKICTASDYCGSWTTVMLENAYLRVVVHDWLELLKLEASIEAICWMRNRLYLSELLNFTFLMKLYLTCTFGILLFDCSFCCSSWGWGWQKTTCVLMKNIRRCFSSGENALWIGKSLFPDPSTVKSIQQVALIEAIRLTLDCYCMCSDVYKKYDILTLILRTAVLHYNHLWSRLLDTRVTLQRR